MIDSMILNNHQIAVLIDCENTGLDSMQWLFDQLSEMGRVILKKAYADWSVEGRKRDQLFELGIEPIQLFHSESGKNSADIRLAIDAIELMYQEHVDTFVIVSSDSDFVPLVSKLRATGKTVIGAGRKATVSRTLVMSCDKYYYLDQEIVTSTAIGTEGQDSPSILRRALEASMDNQGTVVGSKLHQTMQRLDPSFDYRAEGFSTFTKFLEASSEVRVGRSARGGNVMVELVKGDSAPPPKVSARAKILSSANGGDGTDGLAKRDVTLSAQQEADIGGIWTNKLSKYGKSLPGSVAANEAAKILGIPKLSSSRYKTLQGLLDASPLLRNKWMRNRNQLVAR
ncbi:MAG: NYN domain-containing protein [Chloroflexi bacterium]|nr:NYN domain-containing protein [Chloroflexota bacterium]